MNVKTITYDPQLWTGEEDYVEVEILPAAMLGVGLLFAMIGILIWRYDPTLWLIPRDTTRAILRSSRVEIFRKARSLVESNRQRRRAIDHQLAAGQPSCAFRCGVEPGSPRSQAWRDHRWRAEVPVSSDRRSRGPFPPEASRPCRRQTSRRPKHRAQCQRASSA